MTRTITRRRLVQSTAAVAGAATLTSAPRLIRPAAADATKVRALMWSNSPTIDEHFKNRANSFNESHKDTVQVDLQFLPYDQYWQKLLLAYSANEPYDVYFWDVQAYGHYKKGLLKNLQPYLDAAGLYDPAQYPVDLFQPWKLDGENFYAIPENLQTIALYYNRTIFDDAGAAVPDDTWTWDQVVEAGRALTQRDGDRVNQYGLSLGVLNTWWGLQTISWAKGDAFMDKNVEPTKFQFSSPTNIETLAFVQGLINTEKIVPNPTLAQQTADTTSFQSGRIAISTQGSWDIASFSELPFEWGMTSIPKIGDNRVVPYWMGGWVIANASEVADAAFEWARWCATDYQPTMAAEHDWIPILNSLRQSPDFLAALPTGFSSVNDSLATARLGDFYSANNQQIWDEVFTPNLEQLYNNKQTPEETAQKIDEAANALL